jgi:adenylate cyclase
MAELMSPLATPAPATPAPVEEEFELFRILDTVATSRAPVAEPDLVGWMLTEGRRAKRPGEFWDAFCWRLVGAGLPLWRASASVATLHPQILGFGFRWWRERGETDIFRVGYGIDQTQDYLESPIRQVIETGATVRYRLDDPAAIAAFPLLGDLRAQGATDYIAFPLTFVSGRHQATTWTSDRPGGFTEDEIQRLLALHPALVATVEYLALRGMTRLLLDTYLGKTARERILDGEIRRAYGEVLPAIIVSTDMRGFTQLSDRLPGEELIWLLDDYFDAVARPIQRHGGEVLKFIGDGILAIFPLAAIAPAQATTTALDAAGEILERIDRLNLRRATEGRIEFRMGMGLHLGEIVLGNVGAADRLDFTAIGPAVNLTCRVEGLTKRLGRRLVVSRDFARACPRTLVSLGFHPVKGLSEPEEVFGLPDDSYEI